MKKIKQTIALILIGFTIITSAYLLWISIMYILSMTFLFILDHPCRSVLIVLGIMWLGGAINTYRNNRTV